jgi:hypothetical protein
MHAVGVIELALGIAILAVAPVVGAYVASAWLLLALPICSSLASSTLPFAMS